MCANALRIYVRSRGVVRGTDRLTSVNAGERMRGKSNAGRDWVAPGEANMVRGDEQQRTRGTRGMVCGGRSSGIRRARKRHGSVNDRMNKMQRPLLLGRKLSFARVPILSFA